MFEESEVDRIHKKKPALVKWTVIVLLPVVLLTVILVVLSLTFAVAGGMTPEDLISSYYFDEPDSIFVAISGTMDLPNVNAALEWPTAAKRITSHYGWRIHPVYRDRRFHHGIDIAGDMNTPVYASAAGEVVFAGYHRTYGNVVILDHSTDGLEGVATCYAHLSSIFVTKGERVEQGQLIGKIGSTGLSTGPHLHFETRYQNKSFNPLLVLRR